MKYRTSVPLSPVHYEDDSFVDGDNTVLESPWGREVTRDFGERPFIQRASRGIAIRNQLLGGPFLAAFDAELAAD